MTKIILTSFLFISILQSQTINQIDSLYKNSNNNTEFLHKILASKDIFTNNENDGNILISISYLLLSEKYNHKIQKIQIIEKGLDYLKFFINKNNQTEFLELYDELFNIYYLYKSANEINQNKIENIIKSYAEKNYDNKILHWFINNYWSKK